MRLLLLFWTLQLSAASVYFFYPHFVRSKGDPELQETAEIRRKRDTFGPALRIQIQYASKSLRLNLKQNSQLFSGSSVIEWILKDGQRHSYPATADCLYVGEVENSISSLVALNVCNGLTGILRSKEETYYVEPLRDGPVREGQYLHALIPVAVSAGSKINLKNDQVFSGMTSRVKRYFESYEDSLTDEDYETYRKLSDLEDFDLAEEDDVGNDWDDEDYLHIDDLKIPEVTESTTSTEIEEVDEAESDEVITQVHDADVDGFIPDPFWQKVSAGKRPKSSSRKKILKSEPTKPKWLKMAIIIDHTVIKFHGKARVQQYVITLLNIVSAIYQDPSLQAKIKIIVSRIVFIEEKKQNVVREFNPKRSLENVNKWNSQLLATVDEGIRHDVAVWLTRYDLGGPSGYAPVSGVCDRERSCSLNKDEGLTSAFIIAHEVGHVLGFSHDGDEHSKNNCSDDALQGSVMAPMVASTFNRFHWSRCTQDEFKAKQRFWSCMDVPPAENGNSISINATIQFSYSLDEQCRMEFGEGYALCKTFSLNDPCTHLWCGHRNSAHLCKTKKGPPLEGTQCGTEKWCIKGFCEDIKKRQSIDAPVSHNARDGAWSAWSPWGKCSRPCGLGSQLRTRSCNNPPPAYGGRICKGSREEFRICAVKSCPSPVDLREEQCARLALIVKLDPRKSSLKWHPYEFENRTHPCKLSCISNEDDIVITEENVIDGSPCSYEDPHTVCIQGKCLQVGCDGLKDSDLRQNECGICGGQKRDCVDVQRYYKGKPKQPFRRMLVIPRGARNLQVVKEPVHAHIVSLRERKTKRWILNDPTRGKLQGNIAYAIGAGSRFKYTREATKETITARGPVLHEVLLMVIPGSGNMSNLPMAITATWKVPEKKEKKESNRYVWDILGWSPCSLSCGRGSQKQVVGCRDKKSREVVKHRHCKGGSEPKPEVRDCNTFGCEFRWVVGPWEGCSATCGSEAVQSRQIFCVRTGPRNDTTPKKPGKPKADFSFTIKEEVIGPILRRQQDSANVQEPTEDEDGYTVDARVSDKYYIEETKKCKKEKQPIEQRKCHFSKCPGVWMETGWKKCTGPCGKGTSEQNFVCLSSRDSENFPNLTPKATELVVANAKENPPKDVECGTMPKVTSDCKGNCKEETCAGDESRFCMIPLLYRYCAIPDISKRCCQTCADF